MLSSKPVSKCTSQISINSLSPADNQYLLMLWHCLTWQNYRARVLKVLFAHNRKPRKLISDLRYTNLLQVIQCLLKQQSTESEKALGTIMFLLQTSCGALSQTCCYTGGQVCLLISARALYNLMPHRGLNPHTCCTTTQWATEPHFPSII